MMKRYSGILMALIALILFTGCNNVQDSKKTITLDIVPYVKETIDSSGRLGGNTFIRFENNLTYFLADSYANYAYAYYGKEIRKLCVTYDGDSVLALMDDGSVYNAYTLISDKYKIRDIIPVCNLRNGGGELCYFLTEEGDILEYDSEYGTSEVNTLRKCYDGGDIISGCSCEMGDIFLTAEGETYTKQEELKKLDLSAWKNVVILAGTCQKESNDVTLAGISAEGNVYAVGKYADEILSWGELSYIAMGFDTVVGLKKDGTVKIVGQYAEAWRELETKSNITGLRCHGSMMVAVDNKKNIFQNSSSAPYQLSDNDLILLSEQKITNSTYVEDIQKMTTEGEIYENYDGEWSVAEYPTFPTAKKDALECLYFKSLSEPIRFSTPPFNSGEYDTVDEEGCTFSLKDIDGDGQLELMIYSSESRYHFGIATIYNGKLRFLVVGESVIGYYPKSGIVVIRQFNFSEYYQIGKNKYSKYAKVLTSESSRAGNYFAAVVDGKEETVTEEEFNKKLKEYVGDEKMETIDSEWVDNSDKNRLAILGR